MPEDYELYYGFTRFAIELNELDMEQSRFLPPTDTRFRPDQRYLSICRLKLSLSVLSPHADGISNSSSVHSLCAGRHFDLFGENYRKVPSNVRRLKLRLVIVLLSYFSCAKRRGDLLILFWSLHPPTHTFLHLPHPPPPPTFLHIPMLNFSGVGVLFTSPCLCPEQWRKVVSKRLKRRRTDWRTCNGSDAKRPSLWDMSSHRFGSGKCSVQRGRAKSLSGIAKVSQCMR